MPRARGYLGPHDKRDRRFTVGLDGEGLGRRRHRYTLLAYSDTTGTKTAHVASARGLHTEECLDFLLSIPKAARVYGFYLQYDWTMILRSLPNDALYTLLRPHLRKLPADEGGGFSYVPWRGYRLHYLAGMMRVSGGGESRTIWDVGKFFQCSFVKALERWQIGAAELPVIARMKAERSRFNAAQSREIREYCLTECRLLAELVDALNDAHELAGLKLASWHGPGSTASIALRAHDIGEKRGEIPPKVADAASRAFFGGRFEHATIGQVPGPIFGYDIVSAYPARAVELPCLEHARWSWCDTESRALKAEQACVHWMLERTTEERAWGPLPVRLPNGEIVFPRSGATGWSWLPEYRAAKPWGNVRFLGAWILRRSCKCRPFAWIGELFEERKRVGSKSGPGMALKLAYNSCYGKLAQSVGTPRFRSQVWAGMITSGCRAQLLGPLYEHDGDVLAVATDGIYARAPIALDIGLGLGQWEASRYESITLVRPGIYWAEKTVKSRGLPSRSVGEQQAEILSAIERGQERVELPSIPAFGGARACIYLTRSGRVMRAANYGQWYERPARISFEPRPKRAPNWGLWDLPAVMSAPYNAGKVSASVAALRVAEERIIR